MVRIREGVEGDLPQILDIYNASILSTTTWSDSPQTLEDRRAWFRERSEQSDGVFVAEDGDVVGFSSYGEFRDNRLWPGYRFTMEHTVHVREGWQGRGIGGQLMECLIDHAPERGKHVMIAAVDSANSGSIAFHQALGFTEVGRLPETGRKFDRWLDLVLLQRILSPGR